MNIMFRARDIREENAVEYEHKTNVHYLPGAKAQQQAQYSAIALEENRRATRMAEVEELLRMYRSELDELSTLIFTLENEHELLRKSR